MRVQYRNKVQRIPEASAKGHPRMTANILYAKSILEQEYRTHWYSPGGKKIEIADYLTNLTMQENVKKGHLQGSQKMWKDSVLDSKKEQMKKQKERQLLTPGNANDRK